MSSEQIISPELPCTPETDQQHSQTTTLQQEGQLLCWGSGKHGQHCQENKDDLSFEQSRCNSANPLASLTEISPVKCVASGSSHTILVTGNNDIYTWGNNHCGQLGCGDFKNRHNPEQVHLYSVRDNPEVMGVACGTRHTFVWLSNGNVFSFGNNTFAQLAYDIRIKNYRENQRKPHLLRALSQRQVQQVACGEKHSLFLFRGGHMASVGNNSFGQLGTDNRKEAVTPVNVVDIPPIKCIAAGAFHSIAIDVTGEIWCWGLSTACGRGKDDGDILKPEQFVTRKPNIVQIDCGQMHCAALSANGTVYTWGNGKEGQLGHGKEIILQRSPKKVQFKKNSNTKTSKIKCGENLTAAISDSGELYMWGKSSHVICTQPSMIYFLPHLLNSSNIPIKDIFCGAWHATAIIGQPVWEGEDDESDDIDDIYQSESHKGAESEMDIEMLSTLSRDMTRAVTFSREKTTISLADFYAPSPDPIRDSGQSPDMIKNQKMPLYLQLRKQNITLPNYNKTNAVNWKPKPHIQKFNPLVEPAKRQAATKVVQLEQSKTQDSFETKLSTIKSVAVPSSDADEASSKASERKLNSLELPSLAHKHASVHSLDQGTMSNSKKNLFTGRSKTTEKMQETMTVTKNHKIEGQIPQSNYSHRQNSPLKTGFHYKKVKTLSTKSDNKTSMPQITTNNNHDASFQKFSKQLQLKQQKCSVVPPPTTTKVFISSTRLDFVSPEPVLSHVPAHPLRLKRSLGRNSRDLIRSQPEHFGFHKEHSFYSNGRFSGADRISRNANSIDGYYFQSQENSIIYSPDFTKQKPLFHSSDIDRQRTDARNRIEKSLAKKVEQKLHLNSSVRNENLPDSLKKSYVLPKKITFIAHTVIPQNQNNVFNSKKPVFGHINFKHITNS